MKTKNPLSTIMQQKNQKYLLGFFLIVSIGVATLIYCYSAAPKLTVFQGPAGIKAEFTADKQVVHPGETVTFNVKITADNYDAFNYYQISGFRFFVNDVQFAYEQARNGNPTVTYTFNEAGIYVIDCNVEGATLITGSRFPGATSFNIPCFMEVTVEETNTPTPSPTSQSENCALTLGANNGGSIEATTAAGLKQQYGTEYYPIGTAITLTASSNSGYELSYILMDNGEQKSSPYTFTLTSAKSAMAVFKTVTVNPTPTSQPTTVPTPTIAPTPILTTAPTQPPQTTPTPSSATIISEFPNNAADNKTPLWMYAVAGFVLISMAAAAIFKIKK